LLKRDGHAVRVRDYLREIYLLGGHKRFVAPSEIRAALNISPSTVTGMLKKLSSEGLVKYAPYKGVKLTGKGVKEAAIIVKRIHILLNFLRGVLGLNGENTLAYAKVIEKNISDEVAKKIGELNVRLQVNAGNRCRLNFR